MALHKGFGDDNLTVTIETSGIRLTYADFAATVGFDAIVDMAPLKSHTWIFNLIKTRPTLAINSNNTVTVQWDLHVLEEAHPIIFELTRVTREGESTELRELKDEVRELRRVVADLSALTFFLGGIDVWTGSRIDLNALVKIGLDNLHTFNSVPFRKTLFAKLGDDIDREFDYTFDHCGKRTLCRATMLELIILTLSKQLPISIAQNGYPWNSDYAWASSGLPTMESVNVVAKCIETLRARGANTKMAKIYHANWVVMMRDVIDKQFDTWLRSNQSYAQGDARQKTHTCVAKITDSILATLE